MESKEVGLLDALLRPVFGWRLDAPYIARLIERQSQQPDLFVLSQGNTVHYPRIGACHDGKSLQTHYGPNRERTGEPHCTSLGIHQNDQARFRECVCRIEAGESSGNCKGFEYPGGPQLSFQSNPRFEFNGS